MMTETWFEIQYSKISEDDWYSCGGTFESIENAQLRLIEMYQPTSYKYRIAKKTLTEEIIEV